MLKSCITTASAVSVAILSMASVPAARAAQRSGLVGKSYCSERDSVGMQRFIFTGQSGNKLLGSITSYDLSNRQVWSFEIGANPQPNAATATLNGNSLNVRFLSSAGTPGGHDALTVDPASDTFSGVNTISTGSGAMTYSRC